MKQMKMKGLAIISVCLSSISLLLSMAVLILANAPLQIGISQFLALLIMPFAFAGTITGAIVLKRYRTLGLIGLILGLLIVVVYFVLVSGIDFD